MYKNIFYNQEIDYLRFKIRLRIIEISDKKIEAIRYWLQFTNVKEIRGFFGFANFYRRFIERFRQLTISFIELIKNDKTFEQIQKQQDTFNQIKYKIINKLILILIDLNKPFEIKTNVFNFAFGKQFIQRDKKGRPHLITFFSNKLYRLELNYFIYNKELIAIIELFKK